MDAAHRVRSSGAAGSILGRGTRAHVFHRLTATSDVVGRPLGLPSRDQALAGRNLISSIISPVLASRRSLRTSATIMVLRVFGGRQPWARGTSGRTGTPLEDQKAPSQLDRAAAAPAVAGTSQSVLAPALVALTRRAAQAGTARNGSAIRADCGPTPRSPACQRFRCRYTKPLHVPAADAPASCPAS